MHKAGMTEILAKELAFKLRDINNHNFGLLFTKAEFNEKIKNLELSITIKLGFIMVSGITILGMLIKM